MNKVARKYLKFGMLIFALIIVFQLSIPFVAGVIDTDRPRTIQPGYTNAFIYTVRNYKNQRVTLTIFFNETVPDGVTIHVFVTTETEWFLMAHGQRNVYNMQENETYQLVQKNELAVQEFIVPDWGDWTFVFLNLNGFDVYCEQIRIEHQHILWWLMIVIPGIVIIGFVIYAVVERVTKYERVRMDSKKSLNKLSSRSEGERKRAVYWLMSNGDKEDLVFLKEKLSDDKVIVRENAAIAIGGISRRIGDKSASKVLLQRYEEEEDALVKEGIVGALCDISDVSALKIFEKYLLSEHNEILRFRIAEALEEIASEKSAKAIVKVIDSENTDTLKIACKKALESIAANIGSSVDKLITKYST
ncbi:MAG: HEAT repeat domain-containing protein [Asgard group archaeon]|nr:HEAT repeat domain-containing protein [Asgard group archaeon]